MGVRGNGGFGGRIVGVGCWEVVVNDGRVRVFVGGV